MGMKLKKVFIALKKRIKRLENSPNKKAAH
jgi:hypothetical protein